MNEKKTAIEKVGGRATSVSAGHRLGGVALFLLGGLACFAFGEATAGTSLVTAAIGIGFSLRGDR
jgi:hypothetical protein